MARQLRSAPGHLGAAFERRVRTALEEAGWWVCRAAGSKGKADLVGIREGAVMGSDYPVPEVVLVNVKRGGYVSPAEWGELWDLAVLVGGTPVIAFMPGSRGIEWREVLGPKDDRGGPQPWKPWSP